MKMHSFFTSSIFTCNYAYLKFIFSKGITRLLFCYVLKFGVSLGEGFPGHFVSQGCGVNSLKNFMYGS